MYAIETGVSKQNNSK